MLYNVKCNVTPNEPCTPVRRPYYKPTEIQFQAFFRVYLQYTTHYYYKCIYVHIDTQRHKGVFSIIGLVIFTNNTFAFVGLAGWSRFASFEFRIPSFLYCEYLQVYMGNNGWMRIINNYNDTIYLCILL